MKTGVIKNPPGIGQERCNRFCRIERAATPDPHDYFSLAPANSFGAFAVQLLARVLSYFVLYFAVDLPRRKHIDDHLQNACAPDTGVRNQENSASAKGSNSFR